MAALNRLKDERNNAQTYYDQAARTIDNVLGRLNTARAERTELERVRNWNNLARQQANSNSSSSSANDSPNTWMNKRFGR
ncbi:hypothetical protein [Spiroplasma endosymbiont of Nebria brevicollis]|uniref:hypothetical protein n=1 Tax=Spiroplasma endosymbiont of Nebria brevicollis TaxID=3066284 RepID=UPI00313D0AC2